MTSDDRSSIDWASRMLVGQGMPADEACRIVRADAEIVRRHLELHRERLAERLEDDLRTVERVARLLS